MKPLHSTHPGTTLVELLLFLAIFAVSSGVLLAFFFATSDQRLRQQTIATVEQSGLQMMETLTMRIRTSERVLDPAAGSTGSILALQIDDPDLNPSVAGLQSGALIVGQAGALQTISSPDVTVSNFIARPVYTNPARVSVFISFTVSRTIPVASFPSFSRDFETVVTLSPDDSEGGNSCGCSSPSCVQHSYRWEYCPSGSCLNSPVSLPCE